MLPDTRHKWTPWSQPVSWYSIYLPRGMEGRVDLGYPAMHRPGVELAICRSLVRRPTTTLPSQPMYTVCIRQPVKELRESSNIWWSCDLVFGGLHFRAILYYVAQFITRLNAFARSCLFNATAVVAQCHSQQTNYESLARRHHQPPSAQCVVFSPQKIIWGA